MRLDKFISNCGAATRSEVKKLVKSGVVTVNGVPVKKADEKIDENRYTVLNELKYYEFDCFSGEYKLYFTECLSSTTMSWNKRIVLYPFIIMLDICLISYVFE